MLYGLNSKKLKYIFLSSACIFVLVSFGVFFPKVAHAGVSEFLTEVIGKILYWVAELLGRLLVAVIQMFVGIVKYNDFGSADAVAKGWVIVRDVCNMFFIAVLLMIAFGTIFQWETYRYNRLLGRFILMAFLINFSKFIALFLIDFSQVVMMTFVNAFASIAAGNFVNTFGLQQMFQMVDSNSQDVSFEGAIGALILAIILLTIAIIVVLVLAVVLLMRILVLWILVILSPLAFLARTWPGSGERMSSQWWQQFGKYLTVGPVVAFFLWLSFTIMTTTGGKSLAEDQLNFDPSGVSQEAVIETTGAIEDFGEARGETFYAAISEVSSSDNLLSFIISISLLVGSLMVANKMGVMGGQFAGRMQARIGGALAKAAKLGAAGVGLGPLGVGLAAGGKRIMGAGRFLGRRGKSLLARKAFHEQGPLDKIPVLKHRRILTPTFWQGVAKRGERLDYDAKLRTMGAGEEFWERRFKGGKAAMPREEHAWFSAINNKRAEINQELRAAGNDRKKMQEIGLRAFATGGDEGDLLKMAFLTEITSKGNWDDMWEQLAKDMHKDPELMKKIPPELREHLMDYNETTSKDLATIFMGINRDKFDPMTIARDLMSKETDVTKKQWADKILTVDPDTKMDALVNADARDNLTDEENDYLQEILKLAGKEAKDNAINKTSKAERMKLKAMAMGGIEARDSGHWEQLHAFIDPGTGSAYMVTPEEALEEAKGEIEKIGMRKFIAGQNPYLWFSKFYDSVTDSFRNRTDTKYQTVFQRKWLKDVLTPGMLRDIHHQASRNPKQFFGILNKVGIHDANLDDLGGIYDGEEQFDFDEETNKFKLPADISEMDEHMQKFYEKAQERGYDESRTIQYMRRKRKELSEERLRKLFEINPAIYDGMYRFGFHGQGTIDRPSTFSPAGQGLGIAFSDQIIDNKRDFLSRVTRQKQYQENELEDKLRTGRVKPEDEEKERQRIVDNVKAAVGIFNDLNKKNVNNQVTGDELNRVFQGIGPTMVDISEERQKATREKLAEQGKEFFLSEEYNNNKDKYYGEDEFEYNEKVIEALQKQVSTNTMSGLKTALSHAAKGEQAGLAVNFDDEQFEGLDLKGAGVTLTGENMAKAVESLGNKYIEQLMAKNEELAEGEKLSEEQILEKAEEFQNNLKKASSLRLINKNRKGVDARHILTHENFHDQIEKNFKKGELEKMWQGMGKEAQEKATADLNQMGYKTEEMGGAEIMSEYLAEGLANETKWAMPGGLKIDRAMLQKAVQAGVKIKGANSPETAPEIIEIEDNQKSLTNLARKRKAIKIAKSAFGKMSKVKDKIKAKIKPEKEAEEEPEVEVDLEKIYDEYDKADKDSERKTIVWQEAGENRKKAEAEYKKAQAQRNNKVGGYNQEINSFEEEAKKAAEKGDTAGVKRNKEAANKAREKALDEDKKLESYKGNFEEAKTKEENAKTEARESLGQKEKTKENLDSSIRQSRMESKGGREDYQSFIDGELKKGLESFDGDMDKYKSELEKKMERVKENMKLDVPVTTELEMRADLEDWQQQINKIDKLKTEIKPEVKAEDLEEIEVPADIQPALDDRQVEEMINQIMDMEEEYSLPSSGIIDPTMFDGIAKDITGAIEKFEGSVKDAAKDMGKEAAGTTEKMVGKLTGNLKEKMQIGQTSGFNNRIDQYNFLYEFRRLTETLKRMRGQTEPQPGENKHK